MLLISWSGLGGAHRLGVASRARLAALVRRVFHLNTNGRMRDMAHMLIRHRIQDFSSWKPENWAEGVKGALSLCVAVP